MRERGLGGSVDAERRGGYVEKARGVVLVMAGKLDGDEGVLREDLMVGWERELATRRTALRAGIMLGIVGVVWWSGEVIN